MGRINKGPMQAGNQNGTGDPERDDSWKDLLERVRNSTLIAKTPANLKKILENDPNLKNIVYNEVAEAIEIIGPTPWSKEKRLWRDADYSQLKAYIDQNYAVFTDRNYEVYFRKVVDDRRYNPIQDYLDDLPPWDEKKRVEEFLIKNLGAKDTSYVRAVTRKTLAAAVARAYEPGCKFDYVLILNGKQGIGKSTLIRRLLPMQEYFSDSLSISDMDEKDGAIKILNSWIVEIPELAGLRKSDIEKVKAFISRQSDDYRAPYGKTREMHPRRCIFIGTVNGDGGFLRDTTGNRRYWVVDCEKSDPGAIADFSKDEIDQIWAEAKHYYHCGEKLFLEGEELEAATEAASEAIERDPRAGVVEQYLSKKLPKDWESFDLYRRRDYLRSDALQEAQGVEERKNVCTFEIWCECFRKDLEDIRKTDCSEIRSILVSLGWEPFGKSKKIGPYGRQRYFVKRK